VLNPDDPKGSKDVSKGVLNPDENISSSCLLKGKMLGLQEGKVGIELNSRASW
jgi:hypothetical protein